MVLFRSRATLDKFEPTQTLHAALSPIDTANNRIYILRQYKNFCQLKNEETRKKEKLAQLTCTRTLVRINHPHSLSQLTYNNDPCVKLVHEGGCRQYIPAAKPQLLRNSQDARLDRDVV